MSESVKKTENYLMMLATTLFLKSSFIIVCHNGNEMYLYISFCDVPTNQKRKVRVFGDNLKPTMVKKLMSSKKNNVCHVHQKYRFVKAIKLGGHKLSGKPLNVFQKFLMDSCFTMTIDLLIQ